MIDSEYKKLCDEIAEGSVKVHSKQTVKQWIAKNAISICALIVSICSLIISIVKA